MGAEELWRLAARQAAHFAPQSDGSRWIVTGFGGQFDADAVCFRLGCAAVGHRDGQGGRGCGAGHGSALVVGRDADRGNPDAGGHGDRHFLGRVVGQGVRDLVSHDLGEFVIAGIDFLDQPGVDGHATTCHAPGIDGFGVVDDRHAPLPLRRIRPHPDRLRD